MNAEKSKEGIVDFQREFLIRKIGGILRAADFCFVAALLARLERRSSQQGSRGVA